MRRTIVCLANSYKHGGRCIAGVDVIRVTWIRLCGRSDDGALLPAEYMLDTGTEPRLLDLIGVDVDFGVPSEAHPEDWRIAPGRWRLIQRPIAAARLKSVFAAIESFATILDDCRDRMTTEELHKKPLEASLALVRPTEIHWWIREEHGKRRCRALFHRHHVTYDLAVTDPNWLARLNLMPAGIYPHTTFAEPTAETWLTISLSEAFFGWHYKLVAAVIVQPAV